MTTIFFLQETIELFSFINKISTTVLVGYIASESNKLIWNEFAQLSKLK